MRKCTNIFAIYEEVVSYIWLCTDPPKFPNIWGKFYFIFYQCTCFWRLQTQYPNKFMLTSSCTYVGIWNAIYENYRNDGTRVWVELFEWKNLFSLALINVYIVPIYREGPPARGPVAARGSPAGEQDVPGAQGILTHSPPYIYSSLVPSPLFGGLLGALIPPWGSSELWGTW